MQRQSVEEFARDRRAYLERVGASVEGLDLNLEPEPEPEPEPDEDEITIYCARVPAPSDVSRWQARFDRLLPPIGTLKRLSVDWGGALTVPVGGQDHFQFTRSATEYTAKTLNVPDGQGGTLRLDVPFDEREWPEEWRGLGVVDLKPYVVLEPVSCWFVRELLPPEAAAKGWDGTLGDFANGAYYYVHHAFAEDGTEWGGYREFAQGDFDKVEAMVKRREAALRGRSLGAEWSSQEKRSWMRAKMNRWRDRKMADRVTTDAIFRDRAEAALRRRSYFLPQPRTGLFGRVLDYVTKPFLAKVKENAQR